MEKYKIVYKYNGHEIEAGQNGWIPSRDIAERILDQMKKRALYGNRNLYLIGRAATSADASTRADMRKYNGKHVWNYDWLYCDALRPGDYVEDEIVDSFMNALPPACMSASCSQLGEPYSTRIIDGVAKNTYLTFKRIDKNTWEFCGDCFRGESVQRGELPVYV